MFYFVIFYLFMSYSLFGKSFHWELVFYRNQPIHFLCTWFDSFLSFMGFRWIYKLTRGLHLSFAFLFISQPLLYSISQPYVFLLLMVWGIKRVSIYLFSIPVSLAQWRGEIGAFYSSTLRLHFLRFLCSLYYFHVHMGSYFVG